MRFHNIFLMVLWEIPTVLTHYYAHCCLLLSKIYEVKFKFYMDKLIPRYIEGDLFEPLKMISRFSACYVNVSLYVLYKTQ